MQEATRNSIVQKIHLPVERADVPQTQQTPDDDGDVVQGPALIIGRPGRLRFQRRVSALLGLGALLLGYGLAVTLVLTLF